MKAEKTTSGKWRARAYNRFTGRTKSFTRDTKKEAERVAREYAYSVKDIKLSTMTFGEAYDLYLQSHPEWCDKTKLERERYKDKRYKSLLDLSLDALTDEFMQVWVDTNFIGLAGKTVRNQVSPIRETLKRYRPHTALSIILPKKTKAKLNLPSEADVVRLIEAVEDTKYCVPVYLAAFACMRRGEVSALDMKHIDFKKREIYIEHSLGMSFNGSWKLQPPKNGEPRRIRVPQIVIDKIKEKGLSTIDNPNSFSSDFGEFLDKNNLKHMRFHDLRHYCAARMLSSSIPISVVQQYGGWRDKSVLLEIYDYVISEINEASMEKWNIQTSNILEKLAKNLPQTALNLVNPMPVAGLGNEESNSTDKSC